MKPNGWTRIAVKLEAAFVLAALFTPALHAQYQDPGQQEPQLQDDRTAAAARARSGSDQRS